MRWTVNSPSSDFASLVMTLSYGLMAGAAPSPPSGGAGGVCAGVRVSGQAAELVVPELAPARTQRSR